MMTHPILRSKGFWSVVSSLLLLWGAYAAYQHKTLGFSKTKIRSDFAYNPAWAVVEPEGEALQKLQAILEQKYRFLAAGSQSYAFASEDGQYVIKFFRMKHLIPRISDLFSSKRTQYQRQNLLSIFGAHKLAYEELREDTGLIYLHLNKTAHLKKNLHVKDVLGRSHTIDLDQTEFVVQEKAELIFTHLQKLLQKGDHAGARRSIGAMMKLVQRQMDKGIADHDKAVKHNYGFVQGRPIHLDIGRIYKADKPKEYERILARIETWLEENSSS